MRDTSEMTVAELKAEFDAAWDQLQQVPEHLYEGPDNEPLRDRFHSLSAALYWKRLDVQAREDWQNRDRDYGGESVNRWRVRREAIAHFRAKQSEH